MTFKIHVPDYIAALFFLNELAISHEMKDANIKFHIYYSDKYTNTNMYIDIGI